MANVPPAQQGKQEVLNYTRGQWAQAVSNIVTGNHSNAGGVDFIVGWTVAECSQKESQAVVYNILNMKTASDITSFSPNEIGNGFASFNTFAEGVGATAQRISEYTNIVKGLSDNSLNPRTISSDVAVQSDLAVWAGYGKGGRIPSSYINNIISGSNSNSEKMYGYATDNTITNQDNQGNSLANESGPGNNPWSWIDVVKVALGTLLLLVGAVLFIKAEMPNSSIAKVAKKAVPFI